MCDPMSAKAMISSRLAAISAGARPRSAAVLADDPQRFARGELKRDIVERTKGVRDATPTQQIDYQPNTRHVVIGLGVVLADRGKVQ